MNDKTYLVLTPKKIEDIFRDLQSKIFHLDLSESDFYDLQIIILNKKQELLKSIK